MKRRAGHAGRGPQRGVVAVEMALALTFLALVLLPFPPLLGRYYWHAMVLQKITYTGARYMATVPAMDMKSVGGQSKAARFVENWIKARAVEDFSEEVTVRVYCDSDVCGDFAPPSAGFSRVTVVAGLTLVDPFFPGITLPLVESLPVRSAVTMNYVNK